MNTQAEEVSGEVLDKMPAPVQQAIAVARENPYMQMASRALELGKVDEMSKLLDLQFKWEGEQARKSYIAAMAAFKSSPLVITKDKENKQYNSMYTTLGNLINTASEAMAPFGLSADFDVEQSEKIIKVTCTLSHQDGYTKSVTLEGAPDTSGAKNSIQQIKSTVTYLRGATFEAVTGLASQEKAGINPSDDGNGAGRPRATNKRPNGPVAPQDSPERDALYLRLSDIATLGEEAYATAWQALTKGERTMIGVAAHEGLKADALEADRVREGGEA